LARDGDSGYLVSCRTLNYYGIVINLTMEFDLYSVNYEVLIYIKRINFLPSRSGGRRVLGRLGSTSIVAISKTLNYRLQFLGYRVSHRRLKLIYRPHFILALGRNPNDQLSGTGTPRPEKLNTCKTQLKRCRLHISQNLL
jgi:hypothetical protein